MGSYKTESRWLIRRHVLPGMRSRNFKDIPQLQEVECLPAVKETDVKLLSVSLYSMPGKSVLVLLNVLTNSCLTHGEFSSCVMDSRDWREWKVRVLVADLEEGESRTFGCEVTAFTSRGKTRTSTASLLVTHHSKLML